VTTYLCTLCTVLEGFGASTGTQARLVWPWGWLLWLGPRKGSAARSSVEARLYLELRDGERGQRPMSRREVLWLLSFSCECVIRKEKGRMH
jgi:hypothetical protein